MKKILSFAMWRLRFFSLDVPMQRHLIQIGAFSSQEIARGAFGDDVIELQARLQYIGYYTGTIDGKFGYGTYWALRNFQEKFGFPVDGIAGSKTKKKLVDVSEYDEKFVKDNLNKGNKFTTLW